MNTLIEISQLPQDQDYPYLIESIEFVKSFLAKPHLDLARLEVGCYYAPRALKSNNIRLTLICKKDLFLKQIQATLKLYQDIFLEKKPDDTELLIKLLINEALILIFPDFDTQEASKVIGVVEKKLKYCSLLSQY